MSQAATYLGKQILKDVLDAVASNLLSKAEMDFSIGTGLLAGTLTAPLAPPFFGAVAMMEIAGLGLQMLTASLLAEGGLVVRPTLSVVGEKGPEAVIPANRFAEFGLTGGLQLSCP